MALVVVIIAVIVGTASESSTAGSPSDASALSSVQSTGNPAHDRLLSLGASAQAIVLGQAVDDGCSGEYAFFMGMDKKTNAYWSVRCTTGKGYEIQIMPNATGTTRGMDCDVLKATANVSCFMKLDQQ
jgi:hypothetical protein